MLVQYFINHYILSSIKETIWLTNKGICVLFFDVIHIYYWEKLALSKLAAKVNFSERKFEEMHLLWRAERYKVHSGKPLFWHYYLQLSFVCKTVCQISFKLFCSGGFYPSSLGNEVDFRGIANVSRNILAKN